jgi:hypothetical protein
LLSFQRLGAPIRPGTDPALHVCDLLTQPEIKMIVEALVAYVSANPNACDTVDGIERWWLSDCRQSSLEVTAALDWMVRRGYLEAVTATDGRTHYRRIATDDGLKSALDEVSCPNQPPGAH